MQIRLENVSKGYDDNPRAVDKATLSIEAGQFAGVAGPSGSGKTTLLRLIAGLETPEAGTIYFNDQCVNAVSPQKRNTAMLFPHPVLYPHLSVYENIAFGAKMRKDAGGDIHRAVRAMAERLEIEAFLGRKPHALSAGQKQRVALAGVLIRRPGVFLLDEPTNHLDDRLWGIVWEIVQEVHRQSQITMVCVSHDKDKLGTIADRIWTLEQGKIR